MEEGLPVPEDLSQDTIFDKIVRKEIPATIIYEDEKCIAFQDISPTAPVHFLVVPRQKIAYLNSATEADEQLLGHLLLVCKNVALQQNLSPGYRVVINNGPQACQSVYQLHLHVIGGRALKWPPG